MKRFLLSAILLAALTTILAASASARDTDIYRPTVKPNVMIMFDDSGSMAYGVYEYDEDYGRFYDYLSERTCGAGGDIQDAVAGGTGTSNHFYHHRSWTNGEVLAIAINVGGVIAADSKAYCGDAGQDDNYWRESNIVHTGWQIGTDTSFGVDADGHVLYNGARLPSGRDIKLHDLQQNADGTTTDRGLSGMLLAPGYYFSGYFRTAAGALTTNPSLAEQVSGQRMAVLFVAGNWLNLQCVYNLRVVSGCPDGGSKAWQVRSDQSAAFWQTATYALTSPSYPSNYPNSYYHKWTITQPGATAIKLHFSDFYTYNSSDYVKIYNSSNQVVATYSGHLSPSSFWTAAIPGSSVSVEFSTNTSNQQKGWSIDSYSYQQGVSDAYTVQRRIDAARTAIENIIDATMGKINWGLASFNYNGGSSGDGAKIESPLNPNFNDDTNRQNVFNHLDALVPGAGTPLCESAQDMYNYFAQHTNILRDCTRNYVIYLTDGFPSADDDTHRLSTGATLTDNPADGFTQDPVQYASPNPDLFDDAVGYGYQHSVYDGHLEAHPAVAYDNITSHCIGLSLDSPMLKDAAQNHGGGVYYVASNSQQLGSAFYSLGLLIMASAGYTAPVVSVDSANRTQSGDEVYMAFFKPMAAGLGYWGGNLKRYGLDLHIKADCLPQRDQPEWVVVDYPGGASASDATDCSGVFKDSSTSWWDANHLPDGGDVERGGVGEIIAAHLSLGSPYARPIYTYAGGVFTHVDPSNAAVTNSTFGVSADANRRKAINFLYGFTYDESATQTPVAARGWPLGDIVHSEPVIIDYCPPDTPHGCTSTIARLVVVGSNDGMLHVFNAETGAELWVFAPPDLLPTVQNFDPAGANLNQQDMVDGPSSLFEYQSGGTWHKMLVFGERRGGRSYYALDVTDSNPQNWRLQWSISNSTSGFSQLGQTWSKPQLAKLRLDQAGHESLAVVFGGGYDPQEDLTTPSNRTMGQAVYVVDLLTGALTYSFTNASLTCVPADVTILNDVSDHLRYFYFVDTTANVWKTSYSLGTWETHCVFKSNPGSNAASGLSGGTLTSADAGRKMFYPPDVSLGNTFTDYPVLYVGTGDREHPLEQAVNNRIYGIVDDGTVGMDERNLTNVTSDELEPGSSVTDAQRETIRTTLKNSHGWYVKLGDLAGDNHSGEKVLAQATVFYYVAYFTTYAPMDVTDTCNPLGQARVYALDYTLGTSAMDLNGDSLRNSADRYRAIGQSIPSRVKIIIRSGTAAGLISVGGSVTGAGVQGSTRLPQPSSGIQTLIWRQLSPGEIGGGSAHAPYGSYP